MTQFLQTYGTWIFFGIMVVFMLRMHSGHGGHGGMGMGGSMQHKSHDATDMQSKEKQHQGPETPETEVNPPPRAVPLAGGTADDQQVPVDQGQATPHAGHH